MEKLKRLDTLKLIDVVKNYQRYGYEEHIKASAIEILESRGMSIEEINAAGNPAEPDAFQRSLEEERRRAKLRIQSWIIYISVPIVNILMHLLTGNSETTYTVVIVVNIISFVALIVLFFRRISI